ncbi:hypothetical protein [Brachybacterium sp. FME24]|uniref:hypothetical protein n=1 Tax=Brachybacterium sp. FME24 TaxID=2742605 RepID=UPI00186708D8|nr:hypothetical protein [Brachybacterium sp. FME24]
MHAREEGPGERGPVEPLPDFRGGSGAGDAVGGPRTRDPEGRDSSTGRPGGPRKGLVLSLLGGCGLLAVLILVVALVLWNAVASPTASDPSTGPTTQGSESPSEQPGEYVPGQEEEPLGGASPTITAAPTRPCTLHDGTSRTPQVEGTVRGGGIEYELQEGWSSAIDWGVQDSYVVDVATSDQYVEAGWHSVATVGGVEFPEDEGGYPGAQEAARTIFQCDVTRDMVTDLYSDPLTVQDLRDEEITIDGHDAWIVGGTVQLAENEVFESTDAWDLVVIVVDAPQGPAAFIGGAATGLDGQVADLDAMVESLAVTG